MYLKNEAARMELALSSWASDEAAKAGFTMVSCPDLVRDEIVDSCGFAPRSDEASQIYSVRDTDLSLVGTAEIPLGGMLSNRVFESESHLPCRMVGISHCCTEADRRALFAVYIVFINSPKSSSLRCHRAEDDVLEELCAFQQQLYEKLDFGVASWTCRHRNSVILPIASMILRHGCQVEEGTVRSAVHPTARTINHVA